MSFSKSCSCSDFVAVEITTRRPLRIAGIKYASVLPVPVPASTIRCRFSLERGFHQLRHFQLRRPVLVALGHAFFDARRPGRKFRRSWAFCISGSVPGWRRFRLRRCSGHHLRVFFGAFGHGSRLREILENPRETKIAYRYHHFSRNCWRARLNIDPILTDAAAASWAFLFSPHRH